MAKPHILFVCTGNTCRSPMAEGLLRKRAAEVDLDIEVSSAGVSATSGCGASLETLSILAAKEAPIEGFKSRMVSEDQLSAVSHVFCLTQSHLQILESYFPNFSEKYYLCTEFAEVNGEIGGDIADPFGGGPADYEFVAEQLNLALEGIIGFIKAQQKS